MSGIRTSLCDHHHGATVVSLTDRTQLMLLSCSLLQVELPVLQIPLLP